jgi:hypothetical protein
MQRKFWITAYLLTGLLLCGAVLYAGNRSGDCCKKLKSADVATKAALQSADMPELVPNVILF